MPSVVNCIFLSFFVGWRCAPLVILSVCFTDSAVGSSFILSMDSIDGQERVQQSRGIIKPQGITSITAAAKDFWLVVSLLLSHDYKVNDTHFSMFFFVLFFFAGGDNKRKNINKCPRRKMKWWIRSVPCLTDEEMMHHSAAVSILHTVTDVTDYRK